MIVFIMIVVLLLLLYHRHTKHKHIYNIYTLFIYVPTYNMVPPLAEGEAGGSIERVRKHAEGANAKVQRIAREGGDGSV